MNVTYGPYELGRDHAVKWLALRPATIVTVDAEPPPETNPMLSMSDVARQVAYRFRLAQLTCELAPEMAANLGTVNEPILHDYLREKCGMEGEALGLELMDWWEDRKRRGVLPR